MNVGQENLCASAPSTSLCLRVCRGGITPDPILDDCKVRRAGPRRFPSSPFLVMIARQSPGFLIQINSAILIVPFEWMSMLKMGKKYGSQIQKIQFKASCHCRSRVVENRSALNDAWYPAPKCLHCFLCLTNIDHRASRPHSFNKRPSVQQNLQPTLNP